MSILRNTAWNFAGYILPTIITIPALGYLSRVLGFELFGIFTLSLALFGYASIFDAGLTRAVIREVSYYRNNFHEKLKIIATSTIVVSFLGFIGMLIILCLDKKWPIWLNVSEGFYTDLQDSMKLLAVMVPVFLIGQIWLAILEGEERFANLNLQKTITGSVQGGLPALFVHFSPTLMSAISGLLIGRLLVMFLAIYTSRKILFSMRFNIDFIVLKRLISFGGWITLSNIISPVMSYFDRFIASNMLGASHIAAYTAPSELISRLSMAPGALSRVIFPKLVACDKEERNKIKTKSFYIMALPILGLSIIVGVWADKWLTMWLGSSFSNTSPLILQILLVGFFFNSLALISFSSLQAKGLSNVTAFVHAIEVIPYLLALFYGIKEFGMIGVAVCWTIRVSLDFLLMFFLDKKFE